MRSSVRRADDRGLAHLRQLVDHALHLDGIFPVRRVLLQDHTLAAVPGGEAEGARSHRMGWIVRAPLHHRRWAHDRGRALGQDRDEGGPRLVEEEGHPLLAQHLDGLHVAEEEVREGVLAQLVGGMVGIDLALDGELDGLGVQRRAVMEGDAPPELEGVLESVLRDGPGLREAWHDLRALLGEGDQGLDDASSHAVRVEVGDLGRIEVDRLGDESDHERPRRLGGDGRHPEGEGHRDGDDRCEGAAGRHHEPPCGASDHFAEHYTARRPGTSSRARRTGQGHGSPEF